MRVTTAEIDCSALRENFRALRRCAGGRAIMAIVKANAYGHGMIRCAQIFRSEGTEFLGVAFADEGAELREAGDSGPIVVLSPPLPEEADLFCRYGLDIAACSLPAMHAFSEAARSAGRTLNAHLYIDTGMRRDGIEPSEAVAFMKACSGLDNIRFTGVCTHFATSDEADRSFALRQLDLFCAAVGELEKAGYRFPFVHAANSGGVINLPQAHFTVVRPGLTLYGYDPSERQEQRVAVRPAMTLRTRINSVRHVPAGTPVSYGRKYHTGRDSWIATIPIGYGDGFTRLLTGRASCLIRGRRFPVVGAICMDQCMVDTGDTNVEPGEEVVLIGTQDSETISAAEIAATLGTIPYEVLTAVSARVPRSYVCNGGPGEGQD